MSFMELRHDQLRRREAAAEIYTSLDAFEKDLGRTLASGSHLVGQLPLARARANVSAVIGHDAIDHFVMALGHISQALGATVEFMTADHLAPAEAGRRSEGARSPRSRAGIASTGMKSNVRPHWDGWNIW